MNRDKPYANRILEEKDVARRQAVHKAKRDVSGPRLLAKQRLMLRAVFDCSFLLSWWCRMPRSRPLMSVARESGATSSFQP